MFTLNEALKIAGMQQKQVNEQEGMKDVEGALQALISRGALKDRNGLEWVDMGDDDEEVKGPDGKQGWFNDSGYAHAVEKFYPNAVRIAARFIWFIEGLIADNDRAVIRKAATIAEEHFTKSMWE